MEISYRSKSDVHGIGIQINYQPEEVDTLSILIKKLEDAGFTKQLSGIPDNFKQKIHKVYFHRTGSDIFGLFTYEEATKFIEDSLPILKTYDKKFKKRIFEYDND